MSRWGYVTLILLDLEIGSSCSRALSSATSNQSVWRQWIQPHSKPIPHCTAHQLPILAVPYIPSTRKNNPMQTHPGILRVDDG